MLSLQFRTNEDVITEILWEIIKIPIGWVNETNITFKEVMIVKVADIKLEGTQIKFYDDYSNGNAQDVNYNYFTNMLGLMLQNIMKVA